VISNNLYDDNMEVTDEESIGLKKNCLAKMFRKCIFPFISQLFFCRGGNSWAFFPPGRTLSGLFFGRGGQFLGFFSAGQDSFGAFFRPCGSGGGGMMHFSAFFPPCGSGRGHNFLVVPFQSGALPRIEPMTGIPAHEGRVQSLYYRLHR
jgi:hypothetical protein